MTSLRRCEGPGCEVDFEPRSPRARFHSNTCRSRAHRSQPEPGDAPKAGSNKPAGKVVDEPEETPFERATRVELESIKPGSSESMLGQQVLTIARRMGRGAETGAAIASLSKEHSRLIAAIRAGGGAAADPVEEAQTRRDSVYTEARNAAAT